MESSTPQADIAASTQLQTLLNRYGAQRLFLIAGNASFSTSGAAEVIAHACRNITVAKFSDFAANPERAQVNQGIARCRAFGPDIMVAIGGGSVIDMAKLIATALLTVQDDIGDILNLNTVTREIPLIAIPTTAGSGSEATQFAVLYIDGIKFSVDASTLLPDHAILDARLTLSTSSYQRAVSGIDALCQSIESLWAVNSTDQSRHHAQRAIGLILDNLGQSINATKLPVQQQMLLAAHLAGQAINITRTTAPHALSYILTSAFGVSHGQAVALWLPAFFIINADYQNRPLNDPRGKTHLDMVFTTLFTLFEVKTAHEFVQRFSRILTDTGLSLALDELGIDGPNHAQLIIDNVNLERLSNNPVAISAADLYQVIIASSGNQSDG